MIVFCDIDHTISDAAWRDHMIPPVDGDWDPYHAEAASDRPIEPMVLLLRALKAAGHTIVGSTARPEKWHRATMDWALRHDVPLDLVLMRGAKDFRPSPEVKLAHALFHGYWPDIVIDDREDVVAIFREQGVVTLMTGVNGNRQEQK